MRVYYRPQTGRPLRAAWILEEIGEPYEPVRVTSEEAAQPEHLARHPLGRVPVVELDGAPVFESTAICLHLADSHPEAGLIPPVGSPGRAQVYQWAIFAMTEVEPAIVAVLSSGDADPERAAAAAERYARAAAVVESALDGREFIVGDHLSAADIVMTGVLAIARRFDIVGDHPNIDAYLDRMTARPGFQRALQATESVLAS